MTRPPRPPGPPDDYPDEYAEGRRPPRPSFTPRGGGEPPAPGQQPRPQAYPDPYQQQPPLPPNARQVSPVRPSFTPQRDSDFGHVRDRDGKPRPSFTPRQGYVPPARDRRQPASYSPPPTTSFFAPAGYPEVAFQPSFADHAEAPPRPAGPDAETSRDGRTQVLDAPERELPRIPTVRDTGPQRTSRTGPNLMASSKAMAVGTIASRGTGFLRTLVLVIALGGGALANAYNSSNTLPNTVYYLFLGGVFTSVIVPLLVKAARNHPDKGAAYSERIFTLGAIALLIVTVVGTACSPLIVDLFMPGVSPPEHRVAVLFAYFFIPQIFFYGMDGLLGAILNTKGKFGPNMWTPVINNVVVIAVFGLFMVSGSGDNTTNISSFGIDLLGIGTTLGIVIQSLALFPIVKRAGFSFRLRFDFRREEMSEIGGMAGWMLGYVVAQFLANLVLQVVANTASTRPGAADYGYSPYNYAYLLFQLPYAIVGLSVISALLPRMSGHATDRRYSLVRDDFSTGVRLASVIVVPAAVFLGVLGAPICELLFGWGRETISEARYTGEVFGLLSLGLIPFMVTQLQLRVFYSFQNNRGPALIGVGMFIVGAIGDFIALAVLPARDVVLGLGAAYGVMTLVGAAIAWPMLLRHVGSLDGWRITRSLVRMFLATLPGLAWAFVTMAVVGSLIKQGPVYGLVSTVVGGGGALMLFALCARALGIEEFRVLLRTVGGRFGR